MSINNIMSLPTEVLAPILAWSGDPSAVHTISRAHSHPVELTALFHRYLLEGYAANPTLHPLGISQFYPIFPIPRCPYPFPPLAQINQEHASGHIPPLYTETINTILEHVRYLRPLPQVFALEERMRSTPQAILNRTIPSHLEPILLSPDHFEVVLATVQQDGLALQYADPSLRKDPEIVLAAIKQNGLALQYADISDLTQEEYMATVEIAVEQNGLALEYVYLNLHNPHIVLTAIRQNALAWHFTIPPLSTERTIVSITLRSIPSLIIQNSLLRNNFINDFNMIKIVIESDPLILEFLPMWQDDEVMIRTAVAKNPHALRFASARLQNNESIVLAALKQDGLCLKYASATLKDSPLVFVAIEQHPNAIDYVKPSSPYYSKALRLRDEHYSSTTDVNSSNTPTTPSILLDSPITDKTLALALVKHNGLALKMLSEHLQNDHEVVMAAVTQNGLALEYAQDDQRYLLEIQTAAIRQNGLALRYVPRPLRKRNGLIANIASYRALTLQAVKQNGLALQHALTIFKQDEEIVDAAISHCGQALQFASKYFSYHYALATKAVLQDPQAITHVSDELQANSRFQLAITKPLPVPLPFVYSEEQSLEPSPAAFSPHLFSPDDFRFPSQSTSPLSGTSPGRFIERSSTSSSLLQPTPFNHPSTTTPVANTPLSFYASPTLPEPPA